MFLDNRRGSGAVAVYDRIAGAWSSYSTFNAFNGDERMYPLEPITRASVDAGDRLWIKLFEAPAVTDGECATDSADLDFTCQERWWSVPFAKAVVLSGSRRTTVARWCGTATRAYRCRPKG